MDLRTFNEHGQPVCLGCKLPTHASYARHPVLTCWNCGKLFQPLSEREGLAQIAAFNRSREMIRTKGAEYTAAWIKENTEYIDGHRKAVAQAS